MSRTNYIFIDFENVHETEWERIVGKPAEVTLVLGEQHRSIPVAVVKEMLKCPGQVELVQTKRTGKGAADIVLAAHIGGQNKTDPHGYFHIVSRDKGFDALIGHRKEHGVLAARRAAFSAIPVLMNTAERVQSLVTFFSEHPANRPGKRRTLGSQIQTVIGRALSTEDVAATVEGLVAAKAIELSAEGEVTYPGMNAAAPSNPPSVAPRPLSPPPKPPRASKPPWSSSGRLKMT